MDAVAYLRRSSAPNADTRTVSFEMQEAAVRELAAKNGDQIVVVHSDWAKSGGTAARPGYQKLLKAIKDGEVSTLYGYSLSRLSRSMGDYSALIALCKPHKVRIRLVKDGDIDLSSATTRGYASMVAVFAQMERELAQERIQSAVDARRDRGDHLGQAPYGWTVSAGKLVRRSDEDPRDVLQAFRDGGSFGSAAKLLNERKVPTRRKATARRKGTAWNHGTVADIIRQQFPTEAPSIRSRARAKMRTGKMLAGLLLCPCGATLTPRFPKDAGVEYYCSRSYRVPGHGKTTVREAALLPSIQSEAARFEVPVDIVKMQAADDARRLALGRKRDRYIDFAADGTITKDELRKRLEKVDEELAGLQAHELLKAVPAAIDWNWPPDQINAVLRTYFERIELGPDLLPARFVWRLPKEYIKGS